MLDTGQLVPGRKLGLPWQQAGAEPVHRELNLGLSLHSQKSRCMARQVGLRDGPWACTTVSSSHPLPLHPRSDRGTWWVPEPCVSHVLVKAD